jgi:uncharacterized coiled-coil protein SlyX
MSAMCDDDRMRDLSEALTETRRTLEDYRRDLDRVTKELDALKDRLRRGFGQVLADSDRKG